MRRTVPLAVVLAFAGCTHVPAPEAELDPVVAWLDAHLTSVDDPTGLDRIADLLAKHPVVALGEATHGTKQFFEIKGRLFQALVTRGNFTTLAMELDPRAAERVDEHLQTGRGELEALVRGSYFFFEAQEIVELLRWMRSHNQTGAPKVRLVGIDLTEPQKEEVARRCADRAGCRAVMRDGFMAENVAALGPRTLVWAHNGHVAHFTAADGWRPMGDYLRERLGPGYFAIALEMNEGGFIAPAGGGLPVRRRRVLDHLGGREVAEYVLPPAPPEALSHHFAKARAPDWFVDLREVDSGMKAFFWGNRNLQSYGALAPRASRQYEAYAPLHEAFDGLLFFRKTEGYRFPE